MDILNIIQLALLAILLGYFIYYIFTILFGRSYEPLVWKVALKKGMITKELKKAEKNIKIRIAFLTFGFRLID